MVSAKVNPEETKSNSEGDNPGATDRNLEVGGGNPEVAERNLEGEKSHRLITTSINHY